MHFAPRPVLAIVTPAVVKAMFSAPLFDVPTFANTVPPDATLPASLVAIITPPPRSATLFEATVTCVSTIGVVFFPTKKIPPA